jgi:hypothetical protein
LWVMVRAMIVEVVLDNEVYEDVYERLDRSKVKDDLVRGKRSTMHKDGG